MPLHLPKTIGLGLRTTPTLDTNPGASLRPEAKREKESDPCMANIKAKAGRIIASKNPAAPLPLSSRSLRAPARVCVLVLPLRFSARQSLAALGRC